MFGDREMLQVTMPSETTVECSGCGEPQSFLAWEALNIPLDNAEKEELLNGGLTTFKCQKCGWSGDVLYPLLYHDMERQIMVWLLPDDGEPDLSVVPVESLTEEYEYRLRTVETKEELVEKIRIFDFGFDDRVMEFLKLTLYEQWAAKKQPIDGKLYFTGMEPDAATGSDRINFEHAQGEEIEALSVPLDSYKKLAEWLTTKFPPVAPGTWLRVNETFAKALQPDEPLPAKTEAS